MLLMCIAWMTTHIRHIRGIPSATTNPTDTTPLLPNKRKLCGSWWDGDLVDYRTVDLVGDEYQEGDADRADDEDRERHITGRASWLWKAYYWVV